MPGRAVRTCKKCLKLQKNPASLWRKCEFHRRPIPGEIISDSSGNSSENENQSEVDPKVAKMSECEKQYHTKLLAPKVQPSPYLSTSPPRQIPFMSMSAKPPNASVSLQKPRTAPEIISISSSSPGEKPADFTENRGPSVVAQSRI